MPLDKYSNPKYRLAITNRDSIEKSGINPGDEVTLTRDDPKDGLRYSFVGIARGGKIKVKPLAGGRTIVCNILGVRFNGKLISDRES